MLANYGTNLSLLGGDVTAGDRGGIFLAAFTPTLYPSPQGGGGLQHFYFSFKFSAWHKTQRTKANVKAPLPLVGRDTGWGYNSSGVFHA
jgi:hypothetical protein